MMRSAMRMSEVIWCYKMLLYWRDVDVVVR
jgi:hypothetical protein